MKVSARNVFRGTVSKRVDGTVNAEIELTLPGGDKLVAIVTKDSAAALGIEVGSQAIAYVKAPWVMLLSGTEAVRFSARNRLCGAVVSLQKGAVSTEVGIELQGGATVYAIVTHEAALELGLQPGAPATALIKASHVILGVPA